MEEKKKKNEESQRNVGHNFLTQGVPIKGKRGRKLLRK